jgi:hypothetical protein
MVALAVTRFDLFCKFCIDMGVPEPPTPASVRTLAWFIEIVVVAANPNSVLTLASDMVPEGVGI